MFGRQRTFKILCRADEDYCVTVRNDDSVVLAPADSGDVYQAKRLLLDLLSRIISCALLVWLLTGVESLILLQHWYKDMRHSTSVQDEEGYPAFALVNKATGLAMKHSLGQSHPVSITL